MAKHLWNDLFGNGTFYTTNLLEVFYPYCFMKKIQSFRKSGFKSSLFPFYVFHCNIAVWQHYLFSFRWVRMPNLKLQIVINNSAQFFFIFFICPSPGLLPVLGPLDSTWHLHLMRPCLVALGWVLIWVERHYQTTALPPCHHGWVTLMFFIKAHAIFF